MNTCIVQVCCVSGSDSPLEHNSEPDSPAALRTTQCTSGSQVSQYHSSRVRRNTCRLKPLNQDVTHSPSLYQRLEHRATVAEMFQGERT
jgi:hypothetical protein